MLVTQRNTTFRNRTFALLAGAAMLAAGTLAAPGTAAAAQPDIHCKLTYNLTGWSAIYEHANGSGRVTCENGQSLRVKIQVRGGGLTAGKWKINDGKGTFTNVFGINEVLGDYAQASANAGVVKSAGAAVLSKGTVSLALAGTGQGINLGVAGSKFTISRAK